MSSLQRLASETPPGEGWKEVAQKKTSLRSHTAATMANKGPTLTIITAAAPTRSKKPAPITMTSKTADDSSTSSAGSTRTKDKRSTTESDNTKNSFAILETEDVDDGMEIEEVEKPTQPPTNNVSKTKSGKPTKAPKPTLDWDEMSEDDIELNINNYIKTTKNSENPKNTINSSNNIMESKNNTNEKKRPAANISKLRKTKTPTNEKQSSDNKSSRSINTLESNSNNQNSTEDEYDPCVTIFRLEISKTKNKATVNTEPVNLIVSQTLTNINSHVPIKLVPKRLWQGKDLNHKKVSFEDDPIIDIQDDLPGPTAINFTDDNEAENFIELIGEERHPDTPKSIVVRFALMSTKPIITSQQKEINSFLRNNSLCLTLSNFIEGSEATIGWLVGTHPTATNRLELETHLKQSLNNMTTTNSTTPQRTAITSIPEFRILRKQIWATNPFNEQSQTKLFTHGLCIRCEKSNQILLNNLLLTFFNADSNDPGTYPLSYIPFKLKFQDYPHYLMAARNQNFLLRNSRIITIKGIKKQQLHHVLESHNCSIASLILQHCAIGVHQSANNDDEIFLVLSTDDKLSDKHTMDDALNWLDTTLPELIRQLPAHESSLILSNANVLPHRNNNRPIHNQVSQQSTTNLQHLKSDLNDVYDRPPNAIIFNNSWTERSNPTNAPTDSSEHTASTPRTNNTNLSPNTQPETIISSISTQIDEMRTDLQNKINHLTTMIERLAENQHRLTSAISSPHPTTTSPSTYHAATTLTTLTPREYRTPAKGGVRQR